MDTADAGLVIRAQAGDVDAFATLTERHREAVVRFVGRLVDSADDTQDLAQETFVRAFEHLGALRDIGSFKAWLRQIALNIVRQWRRREAQLSLESLWEDEEKISLSYHAAPDRSTERVREIVWDALSALSPQPRAVVLLHYFDGYDYAEIATLFDVPVSTVRGRLHQARGQLKTQLGKEIKEMQKLTPSKKERYKETKMSQWEFVLNEEDLSALREAEMLASRNAGDAARPELQAICIEPDGTLISTDLHRMFLYRGSSIKPPARVLLSSDLLAPLKYHTGLQAARLSISDGTAELRFTNGQVGPPEHVGHAALVDAGSFPPYEKILAQEATFIATLAGRDLAMALEELARFETFVNSAVMPYSSRDQRRVLLYCSENDGILAVQGSAIKDAPLATRCMMQLEIPMALHRLQPGQEFKVALNRFYLHDCLRSLKFPREEKLEIHFTAPHSPLLLRTEGTGNHSVALMPMVLAAE